MDLIHARVLPYFMRAEVTLCIASYLFWPFIPKELLETGQVTPLPI